MNPDDVTQQNTNPEPPQADEPPAWAQALIDQNADLANRLNSFQEQLNPPEAPPEPPAKEEEWQPSSWQDVDARAEEKAKSIVETTLAEREAEAKRIADEATASAQEVDKYLDSQVEELTKANQLPGITNENDPNDPGKLAQRELYGFALSLGTADLKSSYKTLAALHAAGKQFDFVKMELVDSKPQLVGRESPVASPGGATSGPAMPDYKTIHNLNMNQLADRFMSQ